MNIFYGYPGRVWSVCFAALGRLSEVMGSTSDVLTVYATAKAVVQTLVNGLAAINANRVAQVWQGELASLYAIEVLPLTLNAADTAFFNNRVAGLAAAAPALAALVPTPNLSGVTAALTKGLPAISDPGLLEFFGGFAYETAPAGLTVSNLSATATNCSTAFADLASAISALQGSNKNYLYDLANRFAVELSAFAEMLGEFPGSPPFAAASMTSLWNQMLVLPSLLAHADLVTSAPNNIITQQDLLIRFLILYATQRVSLLLLSIVRPVSVPIAQAPVMAGDSLMDMAARNLGDYERWPEIAVFNKLAPPFTGQNEAPGVAAWGSRLLMPVAGGDPTNHITAAQRRNSGRGSASYFYNFLGVDLYFGPLNGDFPPWTGEFQLIAGYDNLRWALGRRMQTTLGTLMYHPDYGSRIPPEVGNVQTVDTAGYITAFGKACLLSDPRVASVIAAITSIGPNFSLAFGGAVQPAGLGSTPVEVNEVINSSINPGTVANG